MTLHSKHLPEYSRDEISSRSSVEAARYIADMAQGLAPLAQAHKLEFLAYLLDLVRLEAEAQATRLRDVA